MFHFILALNLFSSFFLCGLIWTIQLVHYPMLYRIDKTDFTSHIAFHGYRISFIVLPLMITELITSFLLVLGGGEYAIIHITGLLSVIGVWLSTFIIQVPLHGKLSKERDHQAIRKLIQTNWIRTVLWSVKSITGIKIIIRMLQEQF